MRGREATTVAPAASAVAHGTGVQDKAPEGDQREDVALDPLARPQRCARGPPPRFAPPSPKI
jgi:hypothetical protein